VGSRATRTYPVVTHVLCRYVNRSDSVNVSYTHVIASPEGDVCIRVQRRNWVREAGEAGVLKKDSAPIRREQKNKTPSPSSIRIVRLKRHRPRLYDETVRRALVVLWEASDRACGKRLKALVPVLLAALERHQRLKLEPAARMKLTTISVATIDRLLGEARFASLTGHPRRSSTIPHRVMPLQASRKWGDPPPGYLFLHLDFHVAGHAAEPRYCTLALMDSFSGWTEHAPLAARDPAVVVQVLSEVRVRLPFTLRGIAVSSDLEFSATALEQHCTVLGLELARVRPAGRIGAAVHAPRSGSADLARLGDLRPEGPTLNALLRLHAATSSFINFFRPSFRLTEKRRLDARTVKRVHALGTACTRLLLSNDLSAQQKEQLRSQSAILDPMQLLEEVRQMRSHLALLSAGFQLHTPSSQVMSAAGGAPVPAVPAEGLSGSESQAPAHARRWRTHQDAFEPAWPTLQRWLRVDPAQTSKTVFERLQREFPGVYREGQLRSLQRRLKDWRSRTDCLDNAAG
jgi:hypothetical protein